MKPWNKERNRIGHRAGDRLLAENAQLKATLERIAVRVAACESSWWVDSQDFYGQAKREAGRIRQITTPEGTRGRPRKEPV